MRTGRAVEISVFPLLSMIQKEDLGEAHALFAGGERYVSPRFADEAARVVQQELKEAGLGEQRDYLDFVDTVNIVQRATTEYYGWVTSVEETYAVLGASLGRQAVLLTRSGETVRFERCDADRTLEALAWRLPDVPVARGDAISVSHKDFHTPQRSAGSVMRRSTSARPEGARRLDALLKIQRNAVTKLYAARRDADGFRQRSEGWLTVLDLIDGRWAIFVSHSRKEKWINAVPGTPGVIADRLADLARSIR
ncbi:ESX secretion-associated protein EspG [Actinophytocola sp.]|uniref:ESX secretion-associated protein EspG n=1 Tax=Actinophytocola sp. TaxID=1872138 RepID=UPI002ED25ECE